MPRLVVTLVSCLGLGLGLVSSVVGDEPAEGSRSVPALLSFDDLQDRLDEPGLRLLDARSKDDYDEGHIPGAAWVDVKSAEKLAARPGGLDDRQAWEDWTAGLGLRPGDQVVVYDDNRQLDAARVWWLLGYLGVEKVGLIDGGFPLWKKEGRPVAAEAPKIEPAAFPVAFRRGRLATADDVLEALKSKSTQIVDARSDAEFTGAEKRSKRGGRIPGACHVEWAELVDQDGRFLPVEELRTKFEAAKLQEGEPVITHCQGGGRSSVDAFVLERLGFPARNYYLGWSDWGNDDDAPIETGEDEPK